MAARYLQEQANGRYRFRSRYATEAALAALPARRVLPFDLPAEEAEAVRRGLLALRQNVVLLRDPEDPNAFYPVRAAGLPQRSRCCCAASPQ